VALAFSYDGKMLATGGGAPTQEGELKIFNVADGKLLVNVTNQVHSDTVFGVAFAPDDKRLVSCGRTSSSRCSSAVGQVFKVVRGHTHHVMGVASPRRQADRLGGADNVVKIWNYETGEQARSLNAHTSR